MSQHSGTRIEQAWRDALIRFMPPGPAGVRAQLRTDPFLLGERR